MKASRWRTFQTRGGGWVLAQGLVLAALVLTPMETGASRALSLDQPLQVAGMLAVFAGVALSLAGALTLGRALTPFPRPRAKAPLKQRGVYAWVRHPIYAGILLAALGWSLWWLSAAGVFATLLAAVFFDRKAAREEAWLSARHRAYRAYRKRVKKFIPGVY